LWVPADSPLDVEHKGIQILLDPAMKKLSIANRSMLRMGGGRGALKHYGMYDQVRERLGVGRIFQQPQFVIGECSAGFVALAHAVLRR